MAQGQQTTLFDCCSDPTLCLYGWCCGPCVYGETDDIMGEGSCMMGALKVIFCGSCTVCCIAPGRRERLRQHFSIEPECMGDCVTWICCPGLANCQERRELKMRNCTTNEDYNGPAWAPHPRPVHLHKCDNSTSAGLVPLGYHG